jgi:hypothetical protein
LDLMAALKASLNKSGRGGEPKLKPRSARKSA